MKKCRCKKYSKNKKSNYKKRETCNLNPYSDAVIPPCMKYLKNDNVLLLNGDLIYINNNKIYTFISSNASKQDTKGALNEALNTNIEISVTTFIVGLFINQIQKGIIAYNEDKPIHQDEKINSLIHQFLKESLDELKGKEESTETEVCQVDNESEETNKESDKSNSDKESNEAGEGDTQIQFSLNFIISNGNAIVNFLTYTVNITELNYIILLIINRLEGDPALYFPNNSYAAPIPANLYLSGLNISFGRNK